MDDILTEPAIEALSLDKIRESEFLVCHLARMPKKRQKKALSADEERYRRGSIKIEWEKRKRRKLLKQLLEAVDFSYIQELDRKYGLPD